MARAELSAESVADLTKRMMGLATQGCCGDAAWRGRYCAYHQGMEAGIDMVLTTVDQTIERRYPGALIDGEACGNDDDRERLREGIEEAIDLLNTPGGAGEALAVLTGLADWTEPALIDGSPS